MRMSVDRGPRARGRACIHCGVVFTMGALVLAAGEVPSRTIKGRVRTVVSGDVFTLQTSVNLEIKVRLVSIDAPEMEQEYGPTSMRALSSRVLGETVTVDRAREVRRGQIVGEVRLDKRRIGREMVACGAAWHDAKGFPSKLLAAAQKKARAARLGLWKAAAPVAPWEWRKKRPRSLKEEGAEAADLNRQTVYITPTSNKFHRKTCRRLRTDVRAVSRRTAEKWDHKPCPICNP